jgi:hypothetical protein
MRVIREANFANELKQGQRLTNCHQPLIAIPQQESKAKILQVVGVTKGICILKSRKS